MVYFGVFVIPRLKSLKASSRKRIKCEISGGPNQGRLYSRDMKHHHRGVIVTNRGIVGCTCYPSRI